MLKFNQTNAGSKWGFNCMVYNRATVDRFINWYIHAKHISIHVIYNMFCEITCVFIIKRNEVER